MSASRITTTADGVTLTAGADGLPRVDSRTLAGSMEARHKVTMELIRTHLQALEGFGILPFKTAKPSGAGRPETFALLSEDQAFFLLTLMRNSPRVVQLKAKLVAAFAEARRAAQDHAEYLPGHHALHAAIAGKCASASRPGMVHLNVEKLVNRVAGLQSGQRQQLDARQRRAVIAVQAVIEAAFTGASDHNEGYARAKASTETLQALLAHASAGRLQ